MLQGSTRMPRRPSAGFSSRGSGIYVSGLSPPTSSVRITTGRPAKRRDDALVLRSLLGFVGRRVAIEEQELRAQQAAAFGALRHGRCASATRADVGEDLDARAIGGAAFPLRGATFGRRGAHVAAPRCFGCGDVPRSAERCRRVPSSASSTSAVPSRMSRNVRPRPRRASAHPSPPRESRRARSGRRRPCRCRRAGSRPARRTARQQLVREHDRALRKSVRAAGFAPRAWRGAATRDRADRRRARPCAHRVVREAHRYSRAPPDAPGVAALLPCASQSRAAAISSGSSRNSRCAPMTSRAGPRSDDASACNRVRVAARAASRLSRFDALAVAGLGDRESRAERDGMRVPPRGPGPR